MAASNRRYFLIPVLCLLCLFLCYAVLMLRPRFIYQQGVRELKSDKYDPAVMLFERAEAAIPKFLSDSWVTAADRFHLYTHYGRALYHEGVQAWKDKGISHDTFDRFVRANQSLTKAEVIDAGYYVTAYWRARTEHTLEVLHPRLFPKTPNPYDADSHYRTAAALRPAGIAVHQAWARYLHATRRPGRIPDLVRHLMTIYPPFYPSLKKEPYFATDLLPVAAEGLKTAVQEGVRPREALRYLSRLSQDQDDPAGAIAYFESFLAHDPEANGVGDVIHLGTLYLADGRYEDAQSRFFQSMADADDPDAVLARIYRIYKTRDLLFRFLRFANDLGLSTVKVSSLDLVRAQCYLDLDQVFLARQTLERIISDNPTGPACYLRAQIAAREKDWEAMETYSQMATRTDPYHAGYHYYFARALFARKKYEDAEFALNRAIRHAGREQAGYFDLRARARQHQKKFLAAAEDWDRAAALNPGHQAYADRAAEAREKSRTDPESESNSRQIGVRPALL